MQSVGQLSRTTLGLTLALAGVLVSGVFATRAIAQTPRDEAAAISRPSEERKLTFAAPGLVKEAVVKEGDIVKAGATLLQLDDEFDKRELERLESEANSPARVDAAIADMDAKKVILDRKEATMAAGGANQSEVDEARLDYVLREKQLEVARITQQQAKIDAAKQMVKLDRMTMKAPFDGIVEKINNNVGEWADPQSRDGAVAYVKNDPIYIEVKELTSKQVAMLKAGQTMKVRYADDKPDSWQDAEIFFFSPVADASSDTRLFKLKLPNPQNRASGLQMIVKLPEEVANANANSGTNVTADRGSK